LIDSRITHSPQQDAEILAFKKFNDDVKCEPYPKASAKKGLDERRTGGGENGGAILNLIKPIRRRLDNHHWIIAFILY
jgi:hypothetical protein